MASRSYGPFGALFRAARRRAQLRRATGTAEPTRLIIEELLGARVLEEGGARDRRQARATGAQRDARRKTPRFLLVQIGVKIPISQRFRWADLPAISGTRASKLRRRSARFSPSLPRRCVVSDLRSRTLWAFAVSLPGLLDEQRARCFSVPTCTGPIRRISDGNPRDARPPRVLRARHRAMALGHIAATDNRDFLLVDSEDGVGAALVMDRQVFHSSPSAGEIGHTTVLGNRRQCGCGGRGCLETLSRAPLALCVCICITRARRGLGGRGCFSGYAT